MVVCDAQNSEAEIYRRMGLLQLPSVEGSLKIVVCLISNIDGSFELNRL